MPEPSSLSTVPLAIATVQAYFSAVAASNPDFHLGVYVGNPIEDAANNFLMVGNDQGEPITGYASDWKSLPAPGWVDENYSVSCQLRAWSGEADVIGRLTDAFTIYTAFRAQMFADPGGNLVQENALTSPGSWGRVSLTMPFCGPTANPGGFGVALAFEIAVINVRIQA
jgi:hypothetical protein